MFPAGSIIVDATRRHATSAQPAAPVEPDAGPARGRTAVAAALRGLATRADRAARRIEPRPVAALNR
jgi:hypothetical protein